MAQNSTAINKTYSLEDCATHNTEKDCWLIIHGKVYDVTNFLDEHPGGYDIVVANTAKDATEDFEEIGHSKTAKEMLDKYIIGAYAGGDATALKKTSKSAATSTSLQVSKSNSLVTVIKAVLPIIVLVLAILIATKA